MADGRNNARALRVLEIINDFRTLQTHINSLVTRPAANAPDAQSQALLGYQLLARCRTDARRILATTYDQGSLGLQGGAIPATEAQKAALQRIILDASTRRFQAHKIYLQAAAATRWIQARTQELQGRAASSRTAAALQAIDQRLRQEVTGLTDERVFSDLRNADRRHGYWIDEDPSLERILAWARSQR